MGNMYLDVDAVKKIDKVKAFVRIHGRKGADRSEAVRDMFLQYENTNAKFKRFLEKKNGNTNEETGDKCSGRTSETDDQCCENTTNNDTESTVESTA
jgi:hypothetical protein